MNSFTATKSIILCYKLYFSMAKSLLLVFGLWVFGILLGGQEPAVHAQSPLIGGEGPPGSGSSDRFLGVDYVSANRIRVRYLGKGLEPSPPSFCQLTFGAYGSDVLSEQTSSDANGDPVLVGGGPNDDVNRSVELEIPGDGGYTFWILVGWEDVALETEGLVPRWDGIAFSVSNGQVTVQQHLPKWIGFTSIGTVLTDPPCDDDMGGVCPRFYRNCPAGSCNIGVNQEQLRLLSPIHAMTVADTPGSGGGGCNSCGGSGTIDTAIDDSFMGRSSCGGGGVPPGAPGKDCGPTTVSPSGHIDLGIMLAEDYSVFPSSFGPGLVMGAYDGYIQRFTLENGGGTTQRIRIHDPAYRQVYSFKDEDSTDQTDGVFEDDFGRVRSVQYEGTGNTQMRMTYHDGSSMLYAFYDLGDDDDVLDSNGFLIQVRDAAGRDVNIARNSANGRIQTITDSFGMQLDFTYAAALQSGRSAVSQILVSSDGASPRTFNFMYAGGQLSEIKQSTTTLWSSTITVNPVAQTAERRVYNALSGIRFYNYTQAYVQVHGQLLAQPIGVVRNIEDANGDNMVALFVNPEDADEKYEVVGTSILKHYQVNQGPNQQSTAIMAYATDWELIDMEDGWNGVDIDTEEDTAVHRKCRYYEQAQASVPDPILLENGRISVIQDEFGMNTTLTLDDDGFILKEEFSIDPTQTGTPNGYREWTRNANKRPLTYRDREGNMTYFTYNSNGQLESVSRVDGATSSTQTFTYNTDKMLEEVRGPLYDSGSPTMHATTYDYNTSGRPIQVLGPAATPSATRPETQITYTPRQQVETKTVLRAVGNDYVEELEYDDLGRLVQRNNLTNGTNWQYSYINSPGNGMTNNASYGMDDCPLNVAVFVKNPLNSVDRHLYRDFKLFQSIDNLAVDTDVFTGSSTQNGRALYSVTALYYLAGTNTVYQTGTDNNWETYLYDYRGRRTSTKRYTHANHFLESITHYGVDNRVLYTTDPYGRRTWYARSNSTNELLRTIQEFVPNAINPGTSGGVLATVRDTDDQVNYAIHDSNYDRIGRLKEQIDPLGYVTEHDYDARGNRIRTTQNEGPDQIVTETDYNLADQPIVVRHPRYFDANDTNGHQQDQTTYAYDGAGQNISVTRAPGTALAATTQTVYLWDGRVDKTIDAMGHQTQQRYGDCCDTLRGTRNALGHGTITNSDPLGRSYHSVSVANIDSQSDYLDPVASDTFQESTTIYDGLDRVIRQTQWNSARGQILYTAIPSAGFGSPATSGTTDQTLYDNDLTDQNGISRTAGINVTVPLTGATFNVNLADTLAKLAATPANGGAEISFNATHGSGSATVSINHDASRVVVQIQDAAGRTVLSGQMKGPSATTPSELLNWTCRSYDNLVTITNYGSIQEVRSIDSDGEITKSRSDGSGRTLESEDALGNVHRSVFLADGRLVKSIDALGKETTYAYDALGRQISSINAITVTTSQSYNKASMVVSQTDGKQNTSTLEYDVLGRVISETDRTNATTTYAYNLNGHRTLQTDDESKATAWAYNQIGQRISMTYSDTGTQTMTYSPVGQVLTKTMPSGRVHAYTLDSFRGLITEVAYKNPAGTITNTESYTFDNLGRQSNVSSTQYNVSSGRTYDAYGRLKTESTTYSGQTYTVTYDYNSKSQRESVTYPSGDVAAYTFDPRNQLDTIAWENNQLEDREYNANGMLTSIDRAFEDEVRTYDDASRLLSISSTNVGSMTYSYDANDNVLSETLSGVMAPYGFTTQKPGASPYPEGYDSEDRFMRYIRAGVSEDILLSRSGIGNISSSTNNGTTISRTYNSVHAMTAMGPATQAYDADGNATTLHTSVTVDWDDAGRVQATHVGSSATAGIEGDNEYGYLDGKKLWRKITRGGSIFSHEVYIYNGPNRIADYASSQPATSPLRQRVFADEIDSISAIVQSNGDVLIATRNRQWSIVALTSHTNGSVLERYAYQTYGNRTILAADGATVRTTSSYSNDYGYTSREHLPESGLMYFRARQYDAFLGLFTSRDLLRFVDTLSLYRVGFELHGVDPSGLYMIIPQDKEYPIPSYEDLLSGEICAGLPIREDIAELPVMDFAGRYSFLFSDQDWQNINRGCVGITKFLLGNSATRANAQFRSCFYSGWNPAIALKDALAEKKWWEKSGRCKNGVGLYSYGFFKGNRKWPKSCGTCSFVGESLFPYEKNPEMEKSFKEDYACYDPNDGKWYGANHAPPGMKVKVYPNLSTFYAQCRRFQDFDTAVVCIACIEYAKPRFNPCD